MKLKLKLIIFLVFSVFIIFIVVLCESNDDIFNLKINIDVKVSDIFYKIFLL